MSVPTVVVDLWVQSNCHKPLAIHQTLRNKKMTSTINEARISAATVIAEVVDATAAALKKNPAAAVIRPQAITTLVTGTTTEVSVRAGAHEFTIDEPPILAGTNLGASPVEHLLASLGSCQVITYQVWAAKLGIAVDTIEVSLAGDLDVHGFFGLNPDIRPGFQSIDVAVRLSGPETSERYADLTKQVDEHCPVLDVLTVGVPVHSTFSYNEN
jgi:uncharacterized OsmC-like protein